MLHTTELWRLVRLCCRTVPPVVTSTVILYSVEVFQQRKSIIDALDNAIDRAAFPYFLSWSDSTY